MTKAVKFGKFYREFQGQARRRVWSKIVGELTLTTCICEQQFAPICTIAFCGAFRYGRIYILRAHCIMALQRSTPLKKCKNTRHLYYYFKI